jgi:undecaprenyl-diphosphatase
MGALAWGHDRDGGIDLHRRPPVAPSAVILRTTRVMPSLLLGVLGLGIAAAIENGALLSTWDEPIQRAVESSRTPFMNGLMAAITELGDLTAVIVVVGLLLPLVWRRCRSLAFVMVVATLARPAMEFTLKALADRPRPDLERLLPGNGPSFPSGHVLAAIALWGLLPPIVALFTNKRRWWWASVALSGLLIASISASRVYLGVHWFSDVVGGLLVGSLYLVGVEALLTWRHGRHGCGSADGDQIGDLAHHLGEVEVARRVDARHS